MLSRLRELGNPAVLLAPNHFHNLGIAPFRSMFPQAQLVAGEAAIPRLNKVTGLEFNGLDSVRSLLPQGVEALEPRGSKAGEIWLKIDSSDAGKILVVADAFFNMPTTKKNLFGFILWLGAAAPGLRISRVFKLMGVHDAKAYKNWCREFLSTFKPNILIPCHGLFARGEDLAQKLIELLNHRFGC